MIKKCILFLLICMKIHDCSSMGNNRKDSSDEDTSQHVYNTRELFSSTEISFYVSPPTSPRDIVPTKPHKKPNCFLQCLKKLCCCLCCCKKNDKRLIVSYDTIQ